MRRRDFRPPEPVGLREPPLFPLEEDDIQPFDWGHRCAKLIVAVGLAAFIALGWNLTH